MDRPQWKDDSGSTLGRGISTSHQNGHCEKCNSASIEASSGVSIVVPGLDVEIASMTISSSPIPVSNWISWDGAQDPENPYVHLSVIDVLTGEILTPLFQEELPSPNKMLDRCPYRHDELCCILCYQSLLWCCERGSGRVRG